MQPACSTCTEKTTATVINVSEPSHNLPDTLLWLPRGTWLIHGDREQRRQLGDWKCDKQPQAKGGLVSNRDYGQTGVIAGCSHSRNLHTLLGCRSGASGSHAPSSQSLCNCARFLHTDTPCQSCHVWKSFCVEVTWAIYLRGYFLLVLWLISSFS